MLQEGVAINNYHERPGRAREWSRGGGENRGVRVKSIEAPRHGRACRHLRLVNRAANKDSRSFQLWKWSHLGPSSLKVTQLRHYAKLALTNGERREIGTSMQIL